MRVGLTVATHFEQQPDSYCPPLGLGYLVAYARRYLPDIEFVLKSDPDELVAAAPELIGISYCTNSAIIAAGLARRFKAELGCPVVVGGAHISIAPEHLDANCDVGVVGEGEATFVELLRLWQDQRQFAPAELARISGICFHAPGGHGVTVTPPRPVFSDLDTLPFPDRQVIQEEWSAGHRVGHVMTSRGCPYRCLYCCSAVHWGQRFRGRSSANVVDEIEQLREQFDPVDIKFYDDTYNVDKTRVVELSRLVCERGLERGVRFHALVRGTLLDDETCAAMRAMNVEVLFVGMESGSTPVLNRLKGSNYALEDNQRAVALARKHGQVTACCLLLGTPGETREDIAATAEFAIANADVMRFIRFVPLEAYPGTQLWKMAEAKCSPQELDLTHLALRPDQTHEEFFRDKWLYLNDELVPREELLNYYRLGNLVTDRYRELNYAEMNRRLFATAPPLDDPAYVAAHVPLAEILKAKARRRLEQLRQKFK